MPQILEGIINPSDVSKLSLEEQKKLAQEIRLHMLKTVSKTGGHLGPSLGVVDLTIALHSVFNSPQDKLIWDVGHQAYAHKMITGRWNQFNKLRQFGGLSGFPKRCESVHDCFDTGHSSTSISAALGLAVARDIKKDKHDVVAIIGDGALTGGMAFEALNHAGHMKTKVIVVLNDNEMSISPNVGALSGYLTKMRTDPMYSKGKDELEALLMRIPKIGPNILKVVERVKDSMKYLVVPGMLFEELGFTYLGPVDGHNIETMRETLQTAKSLNEPVVVHVLTKKGKGYLPAENNPDKFHGVSAFDLATGEVAKQEGPPSYTKIFSDTMLQIGVDKRVAAITAAMPSGTGLEAFSKRYPDRFFDVGIAEQHAVTFAAGLAVAGMKPFVAVYSTFLQRAYDQVVHDVCLQKLPVVIAVDRAGIVGDDGETHQGIFDITYLRSIPNLTFMVPKDEAELADMVYSAYEYNDPCAIRYPRGQGIGVDIPEKRKVLPKGQAEIVNEGKDLAIIAVGPVLYEAQKAAEQLERLGVSVEIINARFVKPLDTDIILRTVKKCSRVVTIEENVISGGFGSSINELLLNLGISCEILNIALPDKFIEQGKQDMLRSIFGLKADGIFEAINKKWKFSSSKPLKIMY